MKIACLAVVALAIPAGLWQLASAGADERRHDAAGAWRLADERWELVKVSAGGRLLVVRARGGPCGRPSFATTAETASTVELRVQQVVPADLSAIRCAAPAVETLRVRLSAPIGGRSLVDGSSALEQLVRQRHVTVPVAIQGMDTCVRVPDERDERRAGAEAHAASRRLATRV